VVAVDDADSAHVPLAYAHLAASRAGRPLTVLRCLAPGHTTRTAPLPTLTGAGGSTIEVVEGDPMLVLAEVSRTAALLVLGSRGRGRLTSGLFGSVSRTLIRRSHCPVVIARGPYPTRQHAPAAS
jgi:hypothetical protein